MNILELSKPFNHGGVAEHITTLSAKLANRGNNVIVASEKGNHISELEKFGIKHEVINFGSKNPIEFIKSLIKLKKIIHNENIEIVHTHYRMCSLYMQIISALRITEIPYIWSNHLNNIPNSFVYRKLTFHGKKVIAVSTELKKFLNVKFGIDNSDIEVVLNGIEIERFIEPSVDEKQKIKHKYNLNEKRIITILGRLMPVKGHSQAIEALANLKSSNKEYKDTILIITGEGPIEYKNELIQLSKKLNVESNIRFVGQVNAVEILSITDLLVAPSYNEGFLIAAIEAFAMKVPVVRSKTAGYEDMENVCYGITIGAVDELTDSIYRIFNDKDKTKIMVSAAYEFILNNCTVDTMTEKIEEIYHNAINSTS